MIKELYEKARNRKTAGKSWRFIYKLNKLIAVTLVPVINSGHKFRGIAEDGKIIVSLTTFPERIDKVWLTISTIMNQTVKAKRIILWLAKEQFPGGVDSLPKKLLSLRDRGLEIRFCDNLYPHKKYYYTMQENPEDIVVTIDDDMLYPENHLEQLYNTHLKHPDCVVCQFAHRITFDEKGALNVYSKWESCYGDSTEPNMQLLAVGCGGVLYPAHMLDERLFDKEDINSLCPKMDDLWLKAMEALKGTRVAICNTGSQIYFDVTGTRKSGLQHTNALQNKNDEAMNAILKKYPEILDILREK